MNLLIKGTIAFGSLASIGGISYFGYKAITRVPAYSEILKGTLLNSKDESHRTNWIARLTSLQEMKEINDLVQELRPLKTKNGEEQWKSLKKWCNDNINNSIKEVDSKEFQNIQNYCTFSIKEKINNAIEENTEENNSKWLTAFEKLVKIDDSELNNRLKDAKKKTVENEKKKAIKDLCTLFYKQPYKGENDQEFKNALRICVA